MAKNKVQPGDLDINPEVLIGRPGSPERVEAYRMWYETHTEGESPFLEKSSEPKLDTERKSGRI